MMILSLFGGVLLLLYGVNLAGEGLRGWAGPRIKTALEAMTKNRFAGLISGIFTTFLLQSSSATTVTVVSLVDSGLLSFPHTLGVMLGANIGATITVQLISLKIYDYALGICGAGLAVYFLGKRSSTRSAGLGALGFGLVFLSIKLMSDSMTPLNSSEDFKLVLSIVADNPLLGIIVSALLTAVIQSSAVTIGIAISLSLEGLIGIQGAMPIILGANVGTAATALISSVNSTINARRAAVVNLLFKLAGVALLYPFLDPFTELVRMSAGLDDVPHQIANAHTIFNLGLAALFLPFVNYFGRVTELLFPDLPEGADVFRPKFLNPGMLKNPTMALAQATRETLRMAEIVQDMLKLSLNALIDCDPLEIERIEKMDDRLDLLDSSIRFYLAQLGRGNLSEEEANRQMEVFAVVSNLETIGDIIDKNLMHYARKKAAKNVQFSEEGRKDIEHLHALVLESFELAISAFTTRDASLAEQVRNNKQVVRDLETQCYQQHMKRLESGCYESYETSSIHMDVISNYKRINSHQTNIVGIIIGKERIKI